MRLSERAVSPESPGNPTRQQGRLDVNSNPRTKKGTANLTTSPQGTCHIGLQSVQAEDTHVLFRVNFPGISEE
jgi:hypothetical protein